jgi:hypothetical protein
VHERLLSRVHPLERRKRRDSAALFAALALRFWDEPAKGAATRRQQSLGTGTGIGIGIGTGIGIGIGTGRYGPGTFLTNRTGNVPDKPTAFLTNRTG